MVWRWLLVRPHLPPPSLSPALIFDRPHILAPLAGTPSLPLFPLFPPRYDLDTAKSRVACDPIAGPYLIAHYKHEDDKEDIEVCRGAGEITPCGAAEWLTKGPHRGMVVCPCTTSFP